MPASEVHLVVDAWLAQHRPQMTREFTNAEVHRQIVRAYQFTGLPSPAGGVALRRRRLQPDDTEQRKAELCTHVDGLMKGFTVDDLQRESRGNVGGVSRFTWDGQRISQPSRPEVFMEALWKAAMPNKKDPWICFGNTAKDEATKRTWYESKTVRLSQFWRHAAGVQFVVPNPMREQTGMTQEGKASVRTKENASQPGDRLFSVVEFDVCESKDIQAGRLWWLGLQMPLVMVVDSGGKSLHGWFHVRHRLDDLPEFERIALMLGADKQPLTVLCQFVRAPWGTRRTSPGAAGVYQRVKYFDPFTIREIVKREGAGK